MQTDVVIRATVTKPDGIAYYGASFVRVTIGVKIGVEMSDCQEFPNTWEEFEQWYGFEDKKEIYTNGSRLIQSFRVKQWLDHTAEPEQRWIPVSEALPKDSRQVLVYAQSVHYALAKYDEMMQPDGKWIKEWVTFDAWKPFYTIENVIAWMPLPEPWRGE